MANQNNDEKILLLKEQIKKKRDSIEKVGKFIPVTNCSIELDGIRSNIQVLNLQQLCLLASKLQSLLSASKTLGVEQGMVISGYHVNDWITDTMSKIRILAVKEEEKTLREMEEKLEKKLSDDKKTEMEIEEIASMLNAL